MDQITFGVKPVPHTRPALLIDLNNVPDIERTVFGTFFLLGFEDLAIGAASCCSAKQDLPDRSFVANLRV
jgi:hypothetical protein